MLCGSAQRAVYGVLLVLFLLCGIGTTASGQTTFRAERLPENPIIVPDMPGLTGAVGANINGPSLIKVPEWVRDPLGTYYLYFSHHSGKYIRLAYADELQGPWQIYEPGVLALEETTCRGHVASPDVLIDEETEEIRMYFHCPYQDQGQITMLATSGDGLHFASHNQILGPFYFRVFAYDDAFYAVAKDGNIGGMLLRSPDGVAPFEPGPSFIPDMRHAAVLLEGDVLYVFYSRMRDTPERILMSRVDLSRPWREWEPSDPEEILKPEMAYEGANLPIATSRPGAIMEPVHELRDPGIYVEDGRIYLLYSVAGEYGIAIAELFPQAPVQDGYRGIWYTLGQFSEYGDKYSGGLGTYTANHLPLAIYAEDVDRTFFVYGGTPAEDETHLLVMASFYDHATHTVPRPTIVHDKQGVNDPHDNPSIAMDPEGHIWVFISGRGSRRPGYKYRSTVPYSVEAFELIAEQEMTYPQPWFIPGRGFLLLFTKYTDGRELYWETSPDGRIWSEDRKMAGIGGHYQVSNALGNKVGTFFNRHPDGVVDRRTNLYYMQTTDMGETWTTVDGRRLDVPLTTVDNPALVTDYAAEGRLMYTVDLNFDSRGHPVMLYVTSGGHQPGPQNDPRNWTITRWNGSAWETQVVTRSDHNYDLGSLYIDGPVWTIIGPTGTGPQAYQTGGEIEKWVSTDDGATWRRQKQVTRNSEANHKFARRPLNAKDPFFVFWADGDPTKLSPSRLYFGDSSGERYWQLPYHMGEPSAVPVEMSNP